MADLRKDILLRADPLQAWAIVMALAEGKGDFRFETGHVEGPIAVEQALRRLTYAPSAGGEASLQVLGSAGGYCRIVWSIVGVEAPGDLDARLSAMAEGLYQVLALLPAPPEPPKAPRFPHFPTFPPSPR